MRQRVFGMFIVGLMVFTTMIWAQTPQTGKRGMRGGAGMFKGLNLSEGQRAQIEAIQQNQHAQMQALRGNTALTEEQKRQQLRELRQTNQQQMMAVLTPEQQAQMKQLRGQRTGRHTAFNAGKRFQALNLTEQQKAQLKPMFESTRQQMQALRSDASLTPEQRREKMQQIRQNQMAQMKSILTPEQQQQMQQNRGRRFHRGGAEPAPPKGF